MMFYYYQIKNKNNNKIYIGITENLEKRWQSHQYLLSINKHPNYKLQKDYNLYGKDSFVFSLLEEKNFSSIKEGYDYEAFLIENNHCISTGYNIAIGGLVNPMYSEEIKNKMIATKQSQVSNIVQLEEISENIFKVVNIFNSQKEAQRLTGCSQANIGKAIKKHIKGSGYYWIKEEQLNTFEKEWRPSRTKISPTAEINNEGEIISVHHNRSSYEKELNLPKTSVTQSINKGWSAKGHYFKAIDLELYYKLKPIILIK